MASRASMRIKPGLLWEVTNPIPYRVTESPEFVLLNSIWKLEIDMITGRDRETQDIQFNINLRNLCEIRPLQRFKVTTFLEVKKHKVQMKCSTQIVPSEDGALYKVSFYSLCKKLPGYSINGDLIILIVISASDEIGFNVRKGADQSSRLSLVPALVWETRRPIMNQGSNSPPFRLLSSSWKLGVTLANSETAFHSAYQLSLKNAAGTRPFPTALVKTFLDHRDYSIQYRWSEFDDVEAPSDTVYRARFDSVFADVPGFITCYDIVIVCLFSPSTGLALNMETKSEIELLMDCTLCQNRGCFVQDYIVPSPAASQNPCMKFSPAFENLSEDLGQLMDKSIMADVKLKSGELIVSAHRNILVARSDVFLAKILNEVNVNRNTTVDVSDIEPPMLRMFLKFLYTGTIPEVLSQEMVYKLYIASNAYAVASLQKMCRCYLSRNLNEQNFIDFLMLADAHGDNELKTAVSHLVIRNPSLIKNENWKRFSSQFPKIADEVHSKYISKALTR